MNWLQQLAEWFGRFKCWYIVRPWEMAIRVRLGRWTATVPPGFHIRLPLVDEVFVQNVRLRVVNLPVQTVTDKQGTTITLSGSVRWRVSDVRQLYEKLHTPEDWIYNTVLAVLAEAVFESDGELAPIELGKKASGVLKEQSNDSGIEIDCVSVTDFARVKTFRLISGEGNTGWSWTRVGPLEVPHTR